MQYLKEECITPVFSKDNDVTISHSSFIETVWEACLLYTSKSSLIRYESDVTEEELLAKVRELNEDDDVDGFIVHSPASTPPFSLKSLKPYFSYAASARRTTASGVIASS